jgi:hypothetical protein
METNGATKTEQHRGSGQSPCLFTLQHANRTLPLVRRIAADIVKQHKRVCAFEERCHAPRAGCSDDHLEELRVQYGVALDKLRQLADELAAIGCTLGDSRRGIVDFRTLHQGREVELCWRLGEGAIEYWHELDAGLHGRQTIDAEFIAQTLHAEATT